MQVGAYSQLKFGFLYSLCLYYRLINIHIFRLSGLFTQVPTSLDNQGSSVNCCINFWPSRK